MTEYKKLRNQPLKFALAEFRFSPVLKIAEFIPSLQEAMRKEFPIPKHRIDQGINVHGGGFEVNKQDRWAFVSTNERSSIQISQDSLVYVTSEYPRFDGFSEVCEKALNLVRDIVEPALITRIGLRYGDVAIAEEQESLSDLVNPAFINPPLFEDIGAPMHRFSENLIQTGDGILAIRTLCGFMPKVLMDEPQQLPIKIDLEESPSERVILDFDHFWESRDQALAFDVEQVLKKLSDLHGPARKAFWELTTDYARNVKWDS